MATTVTAPDDLDALLQRMRARRTALAFSDHSSEDSDGGDCDQKALPASKAAVPQVRIAQRIQLSDSDDDEIQDNPASASDRGDAMASSSSVPKYHLTVNIGTPSIGVDDSHEPLASAPAHDSDSDAVQDKEQHDLMGVDSSDEDSDGNVYVHPDTKKKNKIKKLSKKSLLELRKETNRLLQRTPQYIPIATDIDGDVATPKDAATATATAALTPASLSTIHQDLTKKADGALASSPDRTLRVNPTSLTTTEIPPISEDPASMHNLGRIPIKVDRIISKTEEPFERLRLLAPIFSSDTNNERTNSLRMERMESDGSEECELEIVAFEQPQGKSCAHPLPIIDDHPLSAKSPARGRSGNPKSVSKNNHNIELMRLAEEQIRGRRKQDMAERQRLLEERRIKKEQLRQLRAAVAQAEAMEKAAEDAMPLDDISATGNLDDEADSTSRQSSSQRSLVSAPYKEGLLHGANLTAPKNLRESAIHSDSMELLLSDRDASNAVAKELGLWEEEEPEGNAAGKSSNYENDGERDSEGYVIDNDEDLQLNTDTHGPPFYLNDSMSDISIDEMGHLNFDVPKDNLSSSTLFPPVNNDQPLESGAEVSDDWKPIPNPSTPQGVGALSGISDVIPFLSGSFPSTCTFDPSDPIQDGISLSSRSRELKRPQLPTSTALHAGSLNTCTVQGSVPTTTTGDEDADLLDLLSGNFEIQDEATRDAQLMSLISISKAQSLALRTERSPVRDVALGERLLDPPDAGSSDSDEEAAGSDESDENDETGSTITTAADFESRGSTPLPGAKVASVPKKSLYVDAEAEVEEDEFMHMGGVDGEDDADLDQYDPDMLADSDIEDLQETAIANLHMKQVLAQDKSEFEALLNDVTSGNLRKRGRRNDPLGKGYDIRDSDEENEELLRRIRDQFKPKTDPCTGDDTLNLERLAQNPKTASFAKCFGTEIDDGKGIMSSDSDEETQADSSRIRLTEFASRKVTQVSIESNISDTRTQSEDDSEPLSDDEKPAQFNVKPARRTGYRILSDEESNSGSDSESDHAQPLNKKLSKHSTLSIYDGLDTKENAHQDNLVHLEIEESMKVTGEKRRVNTRHRDSHRIVSTLEEQRSTSSLFVQMMGRKQTHFKTVEEARSQSQGSSSRNDSVVRFASAERFMAKRSFSGSLSEQNALGVVDSGIGRNSGKRNMAFQIGAKIKRSEVDESDISAAMPHSDFREHNAKAESGGPSKHAKYRHDQSSSLQKK
ncbi:hypothetical protein BASA50_009183 [Batrachochytrium salamandrivorans]|uniref:DNA replication checkpoint mediator MRC1 domain-containing protein n=1 Tax=Batrachochytrium salamandrivorans TaxID=1357716 RepID=A0ABQ8F229_9FUNG|nr:hypothetical protein BASA50_009183 [Batrachochytrium salamandrivorans]